MIFMGVIQDNTLVEEESDQSIAPESCYMGSYNGKYLSHKTMYKPTHSSTLKQLIIS